MLVGRSVNVPIVGNPDLLGMLLVLLWTGLSVGAGAGGAGIGGGERYFCRIVTLAAVDEEERDEEEATDRARTSSTSPASSWASLITASSSSVSTSWSSSPGNGERTAVKVSLSFPETPRCLHSLSTTSRLLVNSH